MVTWNLLSFQLPVHLELFQNLKKSQRTYNRMLNQMNNKTSIHPWEDR